MASEEHFVRAKDLQPGDIIHPDGTILKVQVQAQAVVVVTQRGGMVGVRSIRDPDAWIEVQREESEHE